MSGGRVDAFQNLNDAPVFTTKPKPDKPPEKANIARLAEEHNFPSRQTPRTPKESRRKARTHRTGRNEQFNAKVTQEVHKRFYQAADERNVVLGELMKLGLDALDAIDPLQKLARSRGVSLEQIVNQALEVLEGAQRAARI